jgi:hypothetical protein
MTWIYKANHLYSFGSLLDLVNAARIEAKKTELHQNEIVGYFRSSRKLTPTVRNNLNLESKISGQDAANVFRAANIYYFLECEEAPETAQEANLLESEVEVAAGIATQSKITNHYTDIISESESARESELIPFISFSRLSDGQRDRINEYITTEINNFRGLSGEVKFSYTPYRQTIALNADFMAKDMDYFYETIFNGIGRGSDGKVVLPKTIAVTFDERSAPIVISTDPPTMRRYGSIDINGFHYDPDSTVQRVCYYLYFSLQEILNILSPPDPIEPE